MQFQLKQILSLLLTLLFVFSLVELPFAWMHPQAAVKGWKCGQKLCLCDAHSGHRHGKEHSHDHVFDSESAKLFISQAVNIFINSLKTATRIAPSADDRSARDRDVTGAGYGLLFSQNHLSHNFSGIRLSISESIDLPFSVLSPPGHPPRILSLI